MIHCKESDPGTVPHFSTGVQLCAYAGSSEKDSGLGTSSHPVVYNPPNESFAATLGITPSPITAEQAKPIAAVAIGGEALAVQQEDEDGTQVFGVLVRAGETNKEVKVRIADGAVTKIDEDGGEEGGEGG
jgi:uncharacterized membrane protein YkoI